MISCFLSFFFFYVRIAVTLLHSALACAVDDSALVSNLVLYDSFYLFCYVSVTDLTAAHRRGKKRKIVSGWL